MPANPLISQGALNRLKSSAVFPAFPALNVTSGYLGKMGIRLALEGNTVLYMDTMTGAAISPEPYQRVTATMHLLKTQFLSGLYKAQVETNAPIGDAIFYPDLDPSQNGLPPYLFVNCSIQNPRDINFDGTEPDFTVTIGGLYLLNSNLFT